MPQAALDAVRMRKFWSAGKAAEIGIEGLLERYLSLDHRCLIENDAKGRFRNQAGERNLKLRILRGDLRALAAIVLSHTAQQVAEGRHAIARFLGKIRAAEERLLLFWRKKHG